MVHLGCIVGVTVGPDELEVVLEFAFRFVLLLLHLLEHCLEVHGVRDNLVADQVRIKDEIVLAATNRHSSPEPPI
jgi:hypothetical protein